MRRQTKAARTKFVGKFIGGVIAPGVRMMLDSLALRTAGLPTADPEFSANVAEFPDNTDAAIVTGVLDAQAGLVYRIWHRFAVHMLAEPRLILTGGHAQALSTRLSMPPTSNIIWSCAALRCARNLMRRNHEARVSHFGTA